MQEQDDYSSCICNSCMAGCGIKFVQPCKMMEAGLQLFEPYIATANSYLVLLIVPIFALILMSDFPNLEDGYMFTIYRMGKTKWLIGKVIFALLCSFTIMAIVLFCLQYHVQERFRQAQNGVLQRQNLHIIIRSLPTIQYLI